MIRRSAIIALAAIVLSVLMHAYGLTFSGGVMPGSTRATDRADTVQLNTTFEELADALDETEPPDPDRAPEPDPEEEPVPEPETAEIPTTEVLVASSNPQKTPVPDTGTTQPVRPDAAGPTAYETGSVPQPETVQPAGGEDARVSDAARPPEALDPVGAPPQGTPEGTTPPVPALAAPAAPDPTAAPAPEQFAALPQTAPKVPPVVPVAPVPSPSAVPVIPLAPAPADPQDQTADPQDQTAEPELAEPGADLETTPRLEGADETRSSDQTIVSSLRPQLPTRRPPVPPTGQPDGTNTQATTPARPRLIESPLAAYRRDGTDLNILREGGTQSGGAGSQNFRGPGNSDVTNYMGRVFMHLNRAPAVRVSARGWTRVFFEINPDGSVGRIDIIDGTGSREIERAARAQIRIAEPLPKPPNGNVRRMNLFYVPN